MRITRHCVGRLHGAVGVVGLLVLLVSPPGMPLSFGAETPATRTTQPTERGVFKFEALTPVPASGATKEDLRVDQWLIAYQENTMFVFATGGGDRVVALDDHTSLADGHAVTTYDGAKSTTWLTPPGTKRPAQKPAALVQARLDAALADIAAQRKAVGTKGLNECATAAFKCYYMAHEGRLSAAPDGIVEALIQCAEAVDVCLPSPGSQVAFNSIVIFYTEEPDNPTC